MVNGVGIYVESSNKKWNISIGEKLQRQLDGFQLELDETKIRQRLIFKDYSHLDLESLKGGCIAPESSIYKEELFVDLNLKTAFKVEKDNMIFWVHEKSWLSLPFILQFLFRQRNLVFIHGAGITIEDKGILLPSFSGIGKTPFISEAVKDKRVKILGDDLVLLDNEGYLHPYRRPFCLQPYHKSLFPEYFKNNKVNYKNPTLWNRGIKKIKNIFNIPDHSVFGAKTVAPYLLFDKSKLAEEKVPIDKIYLLRKYKGLDSIQYSQTEDINRVVNFCVNVLFHEWECLAKMTFNLLSQREESISAYYEFFEKNTRKCIAKSKETYLVDIPEGIEANEVARELAKIVLSQNMS